VIFIRFEVIGFSGQGVRKTGNILSRTGFLARFNTQDYYFSKSDSRTSPVKALSWIRWDKTSILEKGPIKDPEYLIILHKDLLPNLKEVKDGSTIIVNMQEKPTSPWIKKKKLKVFFLDATGIAIASMASSYPNTAMLGAFCKIYGKIPLKTYKSAMEKEIYYKQKENQLAMEEGFKTVRKA